MGVPGEDFGRGGVNIQYSTVGFLTVPAFLPPEHSNPKILDGANFGAALACGDFNGDGVGDLAVGAPFTSVGGSVWFYWGKAAFGLTASSYRELHQGDHMLPGSQRGTFGHALATGDFNRDGIDDLAVGDPGEPKPGTDHDGGTVLVIPGRSPAVTGEGTQQLWGWDVVDNDADNHFGWSLSAGPMISGGGDDLAVGSPLAEWPGYPHAGRVYLFRDHGGLAPHQSIDGVSLAAEGLPIIYDGAQSNAWFGYALTIGDFNHDGKLDLAIGIPRKTVMGQESGAAVIVPSDGSWLNFAGESYVVQEQVGGVSETGDMYGWSLAAGDWNLDEYDDLAVGAPFENAEKSNDPAGVSRAGAVFVHYGGPDLVNGAGKILQQGTGVTPGVAQAHDWFGLSLASVRLGSGNGNYLMIGIPGEPYGHPSADCNKAGAIQLGVGWANTGPIAEPTFLLHQDTGAPFNVWDKPECSPASTPWNMKFGDPASPEKGGEFFGWAVGF